MINFSLEGREYIPLCDLLKTVGLSENGGQAKAMIAEGLVKVDGLVELRKRCKMREGQIVQLDEEKVKVTL